MKRKGCKYMQNWEVSMTHLGTVSKVTSKGYGFIKDSRGKEFFFHVTGLMGFPITALSRGTIVEFEKQTTKDGIRAVNIIIVEDVGQ